MGYRTGQLNVAHTIPTHFRQSDLDTTFLTNDTAVLHAFIFTAKTLVILYRTKNFGAKQTFTLGLEGTVVNSLRLFHFAI